MHHRAVHRGKLLIDRDREGVTIFRHSDGTAYRNPMEPRRIDAHAKVFSASSQLGFREGEVKIVLAELRSDAELQGSERRRSSPRSAPEDQTDGSVRT